MASLIKSALGSSNTIGAAHLYSTTALWDAGATTQYSDNLVSNDVIWEALGTESLTPAGATFIGGSTVDATRCKWLHAASTKAWHEIVGSGAVGGDISGAAGHRITSGTTNYSITVLENFCVIEDFALISTSTSNANVWISIEGADCVVRNCYGFRNPLSGGAVGPLISINNVRIALINNVFIHAGSIADSNGFIGLTVGSTADAENVPILAFNTLLCTSTDSTGSAASARMALFNKAGSSTHYFRVFGNAAFGMASLFMGTADRRFATGSGYNAVQLAEGTVDYTDRFPVGQNNKYAANITGTWSNADVVFKATTYSGLNVRPSTTGVLAGGSARLQTTTNPAGSGHATQRGGTGDLDALLASRSTSAPYIGAIEGAAAALGIPAPILAMRITAGMSPSFFFDRNFN